MTAQTKPLPKVQAFTFTALVQSSKPGQNYTVHRGSDGAWVCECQAWKNQPGVPGSQRECKHTKAAAIALGEFVVKALGGTV